MKAAQEGICLLKNENGVLPIKKDVKSIAVVGPLAASTYMGDYTNDEAKGISILDGLKQRAGECNAVSVMLRVMLLILPAYLQLI